MPQRPPRPQPLCSGGPTPAATWPSIAPHWGRIPPTFAQTSHPLSLVSDTSLPCPTPLPSVLDLTLTPSPTPSVRTADQVSWPPPRARGRPTAQVSPPTLCPRKTDPPEAWVRATGPSRILPRLLLPSQLSLPTSPPPDHPPPHLPGLSGLLLFSFLLSLC